LLAEPADPALGGRGPLGVRRPGRLGGGQHADDGDLLAVRLDVRGRGEPVRGQAADEPAAQFFGSVRLARSGALATSVRVSTRSGRVVRRTGICLRCIHVIMITGADGLVKHWWPENGTPSAERARRGCGRPGWG